MFVVIRRVAFGFFFLPFLTSCQHEDIVPIPPHPASTTVSFSADILPVMNSYCNYAGCHNTGSSSNFPLDSYTDLVNYGGVQPFKPIDSNLYDVLINGYMPKGNILPPHDKQLIYDWIVEGAPEN